jgi:hypothetical protein
MSERIEEAEFWFSLTNIDSALYEIQWLIGDSTPGRRSSSTFVAMEFYSRFAVRFRNCGMAIKLNMWSLLLKLPSFIKTPILRQIVHFPVDVSDSLRFKVADTEEELRQAFELLHDAYVHEKLMDPHPSKMRVTKYHALPSTTTLIAIENDIVVGTVSLIRQSAFGLPLKSIFELGSVPPGSRLAEVSALAIKKDHLHQRGRILFPLLKFLFHYSYDHFGVSHFVIAVNPKWIDFYTSILCFKKLSKKTVKNYSFVNGAPAVGGILNLHRVSEEYYKYYNHRRREKNLFAFFRDLECKNMEFPLRKKGVISEPILTPELLYHFFVKKTDCLQAMTEKERAVLREMYDHPEYLKWIPADSVTSFKNKRTGKRFETTLKGRLLLPQDRSTEIRVQAVSQDGIGGFVNPTAVEMTILQTVVINIEEMTPCELKGRFVRVANNGDFGFIISESDKRWSSFIDDLESRMHLTAKLLKKGS